MEKQEQEETQAEVKENTRLHHRGYKRAVVKGKVIKNMLGTDPATEEECLKYNVKQLNTLPRENGELRFKPWWFRAGLRDTAHIFGHSKTLPLKYIHEYEVSITKLPKEKTFVKTLTICPEDRGVKSGRVSNYEVLPAGTEFEFSCLIPTDGVGGLKSETFQSWMKIVFHEGIGSIRKGEFGACELTDFKLKSF